MKKLSPQNLNPQNHLAPPLSLHALEEAYAGFRANLQRFGEVMPNVTYHYNSSTSVSRRMNFDEISAKLQPRFERHRDLISCLSGDFVRFERTWCDILRMEECLSLEAKDPQLRDEREQVVDEIFDLLPDADERSYTLDCLWRDVLEGACLNADAYIEHNGEITFGYDLSKFYNYTDDLGQCFYHPSREVLGASLKRCYAFIDEEIELIAAIRKCLARWDSVCHPTAG